MSHLNLSDYDYHLPKELIAQDPLECRSDSRLLVYVRSEDKIIHDYFYNIGKYLKPDDTLVLNNTRVIPARLIGVRDTGARIEFLLLNRLSKDRWEVLVKPGKRCKIGTNVIFGDGLLRAVVVDILKESGSRIVEFSYEGVFEQVLDELGQMPLPPYITHTLKDKERYQTVYATKSGSAAAPTAGLHFTPKLLQELSQTRDIIEVTLHVGLGTFRPVEAEDITQHNMHTEKYEISPDGANRINRAIDAGKRIIAIGTTSVRTLESAAENVHVKSGSGSTDIFIYPGYDFKIVNGIVTNFHLPKSTLLMLVSAFIGREKALEIYKCAVDNSYRFFSFGDAMLIID